MKVVDIVRLNIKGEQEQPWDKGRRMFFIKRIFNCGTDDIVITIASGTVIDGLQIIKTLKKYVRDEISNVAVGGFVPYSQLKKEVKEKFDNLEIEVQEFELPDNAERLFRAINQLPELKK